MCQRRPSKNPDNVPSLFFFLRTQLSHLAITPVWKVLSPSRKKRRERTSLQPSKRLLYKVPLAARAPRCECGYSGAQNYQRGSTYLVATL
ncbi:hypothetical protein NDU88_006232 [Pleurodeles waltl]|uniref:Uncharacterized protein n=1 Tax=Pleurodeles waltl TaxID=8319 RepID=A0AAV7RND7_PLEWA|nr:hypothetical protein NDU88_006232 [Pleurodeles waltl]